MGEIRIVDLLPVTVIFLVILIVFYIFKSIIQKRQQKRQGPGQQYEYQKVYLGQRADVGLKYQADFLVKKLNELGQEGWRLVVY